MCYAIPGKVVGIRDNIAVVDYFGERRNVLSEFADVRLGDYVYAQGGVLIQKIGKKDAMLILKEWRSRFFQLRRADLKISRAMEAKFKGKGRNEGMRRPKKREILHLLKANDKEELAALFNAANRLRQKRLKNSCCVHGIIEFSNYCRNNCSYCGIRNGSYSCRYRMGIDEIVELADHAVNKLGFKALVLQSGEDFWYTTKRLTEIIRGIKERCGVLLFMSIGERSPECYKKMYDAGARGVLLRFETSNPELYKKIHSGPKSGFQKRIGLLRHASKLGYIIATGSLIGLPGQSEEDIMNDILLAKSLNAEMYSFGPLIPHHQTPLAGARSVNINAVLKVIAVSRLVSPDAKILVTTALETLDKKNGKRLGLLSGANSLMINLTPPEYRKCYNIYPGRPDMNNTARSIEETLKLLYSLGRAPTDLGR